MFCFCMGCRKAELRRHRNKSRTALHPTACHCTASYIPYCTASLRFVSRHLHRFHSIESHRLPRSARTKAKHVVMPALCRGGNKIRLHQPVVPAHYGSLPRSVTTGMRNESKKKFRCPLVVATAAWLAPSAPGLPRSSDKKYARTPSPARAR